MPERDSYVIVGPRVLESCVLKIGSDKKKIGPSSNQVFTLVAEFA